MNKHYFDINEFKLIIAMYKNDYTIKMDDLGPFGKKTGYVTSIDVDDFVVHFDTAIDQSGQKYLEWDRCIGDIYCYEDDYFEFLDKHEELRTKKYFLCSKIYYIARMKRFMREHEISVEDLK